MAIRYASTIFTFEKYFPEADSADQARAYANRAFIIFGKEDEGIFEDIEAGLKLIYTTKSGDLSKFA